MKRLLPLVIVLAISLTGCQIMTDLTAEPKPNLFQNHTQKKQMNYQDNLVITNSRYDVSTTIEKIKQGLSDKGMTIFAVIDHQAHAQAVNLEMSPATVIIFGTPKAGTPLMQKEPTFALNLPLKVLVYEEDGTVKVAMMRSEKLIDGTTITMGDIKNTLAKAEGLIASLVQ